MTNLEVSARIAACLLSASSVALVAWWLTELALPRPSRLGLRVLAAFACHGMLTAVLVQTLGLFGHLRALEYLLFSLMPGALLLCFEATRRSSLGGLRSLAVGVRAWVMAPAWGLGAVSVGLVVALAARRLALPADIDALTMHGPLIVEWVQHGVVPLSWHWNYPQSWEYQFVPAFLLLHSDALTVLPAAGGAAAFWLAWRELAVWCGLRGYGAYLCGLLVLAMPLVWREALKGDVVFAVGLMLGALACTRRLGGRGRGSLWLLQLSTFWLLGSKATGLAYAALLLVAYGLAAWQGPQRPRPAAGNARSIRWWLAAAAVVAAQLSAAAVQLQNVRVNGNPVYPLQLRLGPWLLSARGVDVSGTSILDRLGQQQTWNELLHAGAMVGLEWQALLVFLAIAAVGSGRALGARALRRQQLERSRLRTLMLVTATLVLLLLFVATPWTCSLGSGPCIQLTTGRSLRFGLAAVSLLYLLTISTLLRWFGRRRLVAVLVVAVPALVIAKLERVGWWEGDFLSAIIWVTATAVLLLVLRAWVRRWRRRTRVAGWGRAVAALVFAAVLLTVWVRHVETFRVQRWVPSFGAIRALLASRAPTTIAVVDRQVLFRYVLYGPRFAHRVELVPASLLLGVETVPEEIRLVFLFSRPGAVADSMPALATRLVAAGWSEQARAQGGTMLLLGR